MGIRGTEDAAEPDPGVNHLDDILETGVKSGLAGELTFLKLYSLFLWRAMGARPDGSIIQNRMLIAETGRPAHKINASQDLFYSTPFQTEEAFDSLRLN